MDTLDLIISIFIIVIFILIYLIGQLTIYNSNMNPRLKFSISLKINSCLFKAILINFEKQADLYYGNKNIKIWTEIYSN